jgi:hypothetical protein
MRKPDGTGGAMKKNVPVAEVGEDAATGWTATRAAPAANTNVNNLTLKRVMNPSLLRLVS